LAGGFAGLAAGFVGLVAGAVVVVAGFSGALGAFLLSAVIISVVKSALSLQYKTTGT
jgi:hypothetical protein